MSIGQWSAISTGPKIIKHLLLLSNCFKTWQ